VLEVLKNLWFRRYDKSDYSFNIYDLNSIIDYCVIFFATSVYAALAYNSQTLSATKDRGHGFIEPYEQISYSPSYTLEFFLLPAFLIGLLFFARHYWGKKSDHVEITNFIKSEKIPLPNNVRVIALNISSFAERTTVFFKSIAAPIEYKIPGGSRKELLKARIYHEIGHHKKSDSVVIFLYVVLIVYILYFNISYGFIETYYSSYSYSHETFGEYVSRRVANPLPILKSMFIPILLLIRLRHTIWNREYRADTYAHSEMGESYVKYLRFKARIERDQKPKNIIIAIFQRIIHPKYEQRLDRITKERSSYINIVVNLAILSACILYGTGKADLTISASTTSLLPNFSIIFSGYFHEALTEFAKALYANIALLASGAFKILAVIYLLCVGVYALIISQKWQYFAITASAYAYALLLSFGTLGGNPYNQRYDERLIEERNAKCITKRVRERRVKNLVDTYVACYKDRYSDDENFIKNMCATDVSLKSRSTKPPKKKTYGIPSNDSRRLRWALQGAVRKMEFQYRSPTQYSDSAIEGALRSLKPSIEEHIEKSEIYNYSKTTVRYLKKWHAAISSDGRSFDFESNPEIFDLFGEGQPKLWVTDSSYINSNLDKSLSNISSWIAGHNENGKLQDLLAELGLKISELPNQIRQEISIVPEKSSAFQTPDLAIEYVEKWREAIAPDGRSFDFEKMPNTHQYGDTGRLSSLKKNLIAAHDAVCGVDITTYVESGKDRYFRPPVISGCSGAYVRDLRPITKAPEC